MRRIAWALLILLLFSTLSPAATKEEQSPDPEMLKMMDLLKEWDVIKDLEFLRQMGDRNRTQGASTESGPGNNRPEKTRDNQK